MIVSLHWNQVTSSVEAKFETEASALLFQNAASTLAKAQDPDFINLYFSNSVTQATCVRIKVLKAIAKKLTAKTESAFVQSFISRPVFQRVRASNRFGDLVQDLDLTSVNKPSGWTFRGAMEQYFVLLREAKDFSVASEVNLAPLGLW